MTWITFLCTIALRNKTVAHTFLPSLDNADGRLCKERFLRSRNFASMVMWRHTPLLYYIPKGSANKTRAREDGTQGEEN